MVHNKYTNKNGKLYGPYLYENKRVGDKVVTSYIGKNKNKNVFSYILIAIILLVLSYFLFSNFKNPVGKASLELDLVYDVGEPILGEMKFNLKEGEFVPRDSEVVIDYGNQSKTYKLYDLVVDTPTNGNFFAENTKISGDGEGFGVLGNKIIYPEISFDLLVYDSDKEPEEVLVPETDSSDVGISDEEVVVESPSEEIPADEQEDSSDVEADVPAESPVGEVPAESRVGETPSEEPPSSQNADSSVEESPGRGNSNAGSESSSSSSDSSSSSSDSSSSGESS